MVNDIKQFFFSFLYLPSTYPLRVGSFSQLNSRNYLYILDTRLCLEKYEIWSYFLTVCGLSFHSLNRVLCRAIVLKVHDVQSGLPQWLSGKEPTCISGAAGDVGLIPGSGRSPGGGHGNLLQYSC